MTSKRWMRGFRPVHNTQIHSPLAIAAGSPRTPLLLIWGTSPFPDQHKSSIQKSHFPALLLNDKSLEWGFHPRSASPVRHLKHFCLKFWIILFFQLLSFWDPICILYSSIHYSSNTSFTSPMFTGIFIDARNCSHCLSLLQICFLFKMKSWHICLMYVRPTGQVQHN